MLYVGGLCARSETLPFSSFAREVANLRQYRSEAKLMLPYFTAFKTKFWCRVARDLVCVFASSSCRTGQTVWDCEALSEAKQSCKTMSSQTLPRPASHHHTGTRDCAAQTACTPFRFALVFVRTEHASSGSSIAKEALPGQTQLKT